MEPDCVDDGVAVRITNYHPITGTSFPIEANNFDALADILSCFMVQLQLPVGYQRSARDNTSEMQEALSKTFECLRHKISSYGLTSVETNRSGRFETNVFTYGPIHGVKNDTQAEIDRLRERIRILEQDVERAFSSIAELSTGGSVKSASDAIEQAVKAAIDTLKFDFTMSYEPQEDDKPPKIFGTVNATTSDPFIAGYTGWTLRR